jgi:hypothetical protein
LISVGSRAAFGYDAATGEEIWTVTHSDFNAAAPPLRFKDTAIINSGTGGANLMAVRLDDSTRGNVTATHLAWNRTKGNSRLSAPVLARNRVWMVTDKGVLYGIDAANGTEQAVLRLGGSHVATPVVVGENLYVCDEGGTTTVVRTSLPPKVLAKNKLAEGMRASPAVADGAIYLRTFHGLYKIAEAAGPK